jgi:hypothetical protein
MKTLTLLLTIISFTLVANDRTYEALLRELGTPTSELVLPDNTVILNYDEVEFFYIDYTTHRIIKQRSYVSRYIAKRLVKEYSKKYEYINGWYHIDDLKLRILIENNDHVVEIIDNPKPINHE